MKNKLTIGFVFVVVIVAALLIVSNYYVFNCEKGYSVIEILNSAESSNKLEDLSPFELLIKVEPDTFVNIDSDLYSHMTLFYACRNGFVEVSFYAKKDANIRPPEKDYQLSAARFVEVGDTAFQDKWWVADADMYADKITAISR